MARPKCAPKVPLPVDRSPNPTTCLVTGIRIRSAVFPLCTGQTDRRTDAQTDRSYTRKFDYCRSLRSESNVRGLIIILLGRIALIAQRPRPIAIKLSRGRSVGQYVQCPVHCVKTDRIRQPFGIILGRALVTNRDFSAYVCYSAATRPSSQITLGRLVAVSYTHLTLPTNREV